MIKHDYFYTNTIFLALGTLLIRGVFIALSSKIKISEKVRELFTFIPAAILPAFIIPATFYHDGMMASIGGKERFLVLVASSLIFLIVRHTLAIIVFGLTLLYFTRYLT